MGLGSCQGQTAPQSPPVAAQARCADRRFQDSLVVRYLEHGAQRFGYNHPNWERYCDSLLAVCPNVAEAYREKAIPYLKNGDYARAFALEDQAVALDPQRWTAYRGFLKCIFTRDYAGALVDFERAEALRPGGAEMDHGYWFYRGLCHLELGQYPAAAADLRRDEANQQQGDPRRPVHFNTRLYQGIVAYELHDYQQARQYLTQCLSTYQQLPDAHYYLALTLRRQGQPEAARQHLTQAADFLRRGYGLNEDNTYYAYYPHQITPYEVEQARQATP